MKEQASVAASEDGRRERGRLHGGMRNGKEAEENEQQSQMEHLGEQEIMRQSCRDSGTVSQARLKYKWKILTEPHQSHIGE